MPWGAAVAAVGAVAGAEISSSASKSAANTEAQAGEASIAEQQREFDIGQQNLKPYQQLGQQALYTLGDYLGLPGYANGGADPNNAPFNIGDMQYQQGGTTGWQANINGQWVDLNPATTDFNQLQQKQQAQQTSTPSTPGPNTGSLLTPFTFNPANDPGYQAGLTAGTTAISNASAATGGTSGSGNLSGATLKELLAFGQQYAGTQQQIDFSQNQAQKNQTYSMLSGAAGMGEGATTTAVNAGNTTAANIGNTLTGVGNAQAAGIVGSANAGAAGITNAANSYQQNLLLSSILKNQNPGVSGVNSGISLPSGDTSSLIQ